MRLLLFCVSVASSLFCAPAIAQEQERKQDNGELLAACVEQAKQAHPGPDFTERYRAVEVCETQYPYEYKPATTVSASIPEIDWGKMRRVAEQFVRGQLIDPSSAHFEWPYGFVNGSWKPLLRKRVTGYVTCGYVNARNRMGGYVGKRAFVVVINNYQVDYGGIGNGGASDLLRASCQKSASSFPSPQAGMFPDPRPRTGIVSVADELKKLASLLDRGVITQAEFDVEKQKLLNR